MAFDPENREQVSRLLRAIEWSDSRLRVRREQRFDHIRQLVGKHYGEHGAPENVPINMIEMGVNIFQRHIASHTPQVLVDSPYMELAPAASDLELTVNYEIARMELADAINDAGIDALFAMGVMLVGISSDDTPADEEGYQRDAGHIFADAVPFEDMILDMSANRWDRQSYIGNRFRVPFEWVKDNPRYDKKVRDRITSPTTKESVSFADQDTRPEMMGRGNSPHTDEYQDHIDLFQVYLPAERIMMQMAWGRDLPPLAVIPFDEAPERGPYHRLSFGKVPSNIIPLAPVPLWYDLHDFTNQCFNKTIDQALRQKTVTAVSSSATKDGETLREARDGDMVTVESAREIAEISNGGANPQTLGMAIQAKGLMSLMAGNLELLGGIAAQTRTVGQDELLASNANGRVRDMQDKMVTFTTGIVRDIAYWMWENPLSEYHLTKPIEGTPYSIPVTWTPESRMGRFFDYNFKVNPYSLQSQSPTEIYGSLMQILTQVVVPSLPMMQSQGIDLDWEMVIKDIARYSNRPEINRWTRYFDGEQRPQRGPVEPTGMPASTTRHYVRENRPAATQAGKERVLIEQLMGGNPQPDETASLERMVS